MSLSLDELQARLSELGLFSQAELRAFVEALPDDQKLTDAESFLQALVRGKRLTRYQALQIGARQGQALVLGNYVILDKLGQGGMGEVFKAQHLRMQRVIALKVLPQRFVKDQDAVRRFQREVVAAARLVHPNIVTAYDADEAKGTHFLVMEFVPGQDLARLVRQTGALSVGQALRCLIQAARGLEYAHAHGVVHRDVKPSNLLIEPGGAVKVLDLGLARIDSSAAGQAELTYSGEIMGTVDYMAPEQAENTKLADARCDIYSLGMTLWFLLTGRSCFEGESLASKLVAHRQAPVPSLQQVRPDVSPELATAFEKLAAKDPSARYQSMTEAIAALQGCLNELTDATQAVADDNEITIRLASVSKREEETVVFVKQVVESTQRFIALEPTLHRGLDSAGQRPISPAGARRRISLAMPIAFLGGAAMILLAAWLLMPNLGDNVLIEVTDPRVAVVIDDGALTINGAVKHKLKLRPGEHELAVKCGSAELTEKLTIGRSRATTLLVEVVGSRLQVKQDGKVLGSVALAEPAAAEPPIAKAKRFVLEFAAGSKVEVDSLKLDPTGDWTLEAYVMSGAGEAGKPGLLLGTPQQFMIHFDPQQYILSLDSWHADGAHRLGPIEVAPNRRMHVAAVRAEHEHRLYVEGILVSRERIESPLAASKVPFTISGHFAGTIEEVRVSNVARYNEPFKPDERFEPDGETLAIYQLKEASSDSIKDTSDHSDSASRGASDR